uniref:Uncharacterized protein n=1 Tax=Timema cristinae TaxID=61476 RepID=A0A7R9GWI8_TIMCR|nr:unnamed protein product [Timema cristinae]
MCHVVRVVAARIDLSRWKITLSTPDQDSNLNIPIISSLVYCESSALDHAATKVETYHPHPHSVQSDTVHCFEDPRGGACVQSIPPTPERFLLRQQRDWGNFRAGRWQHRFTPPTAI